MAERILRINLKSTYGLPHTLLKRRLDIIKNKQGDYFSKYTKTNQDMKKTTLKNKLVSRDVDKFITELSTIKLPAFPQHKMGLDGGFTELIIGDYSGRSHFRWWSEPPEGWEELNKITKQIISYCNI